MRRRCSWPANASLKVKRAVRFPFLDYSTLDKRKAACETELAINRRTAPDIYRRVVAITREAGRAAGARRPRRAGRMGGRDAPLRREPARSTISPRRERSTRRWPTRSAAPSRPRMPMRSPPTPRAGSPRSKATSTSMSTPSASSPTCSRPRRTGRSRTPAAPPSRASARCCRARADGLHPPHPWRPASRQYRAARRQPGAVRRHRVQRGDRVGRRALRPRLPADGPGRARSRAGGEHRVQPLPRRSQARREPRRARRAAVLPLDAGGDPRQGDGGAARACQAGRAAGDRAHRPHLFRLGAPLHRAGAAGHGRGRRAVRHRQVGAGARARARARAAAGRGRAPLRRRAQGAVRQGRVRAAAAGGLHAGDDRAGLRRDRREGAARRRRRTFGHPRRGVRAARRA